MSSGQERQRDGNQDIVDEQSMIDISTTHHVDSDNESESYIRSQWFDKATSGNTNEIKRLLQLGAKIGWDNSEKMTLLHLAAKGGYLEVIDLLIMLGGTIEARDMYSNTAIHLAAVNGHKDVVDLLIMYGAAVDARNEALDSALHLAARNGHKDVVDWLIEHSAAVDAINEKSETALHWAAVRGHEEVVNLLIEHGAAVDAKDNYSETALHWAAEYGQKEVIELLIEHGAAVDARNEASDTALHLAATSGHKDIVDFLITYGAAVDARNDTSETALHLAAGSGHKDVVSLLIEHGAAINAKNKHSDTALHFAAGSGDIEVVDLLIKHGAAVDATNKNLATSLHWAAGNGHKDVVNLLIRHGAVVDACNDKSDTALYWAAGNGHTEVVHLLMNCGAVLDGTYEDFAIALQMAATNGHKEVVGLLIKHGTGVDTRDSNSDTALHLAARNGHKEVVDILIKHGVAVGVSNNNENTALHLAAENGHRDVVDFIIEHGALVEATNVNGQTPLMLAVQADELSVVSLLIEKGSNIDVNDVTSLTPLQWSAKNGQLAVVELLLQENVNIEATTNHGDTALHLASEFKHSAIVASLINHYANIEAKNDDDNTPIQLALLNGHVEIVDQLKLAGAKIDKISKITSDMLYQASLAGQVTLVRKTLDMFDDEPDRMFFLNTTLHRAVQDGQTDAVSTILNCGADIESLNEDGLSPLFLAGQYPEVISYLIHHGACIQARNQKDKHQGILHHYASQGQMEGLILLLNCNSDINGSDNDNDTVLHYAAEIGDYRVASMLLQRGVDINAKNVRGENALHCATRCGDCETVNLLLQRGVDINAKNVNGESPLHIAVENNMIEVADILINNAIDIDATNYMLKSTALHLAIEANNSKLIKLLVERHADINAIDRNNETALHIAARKDFIEECALLVMHGANIDAKGIFDRTPLYYAVEYGNENLVSLLLNHGASVYETDRFGNLMAHSIFYFKRLTGYESERKFIEVIRMLIEAGADTSGVEDMTDLEKRFPTLRDAVSKSSNRHLNKTFAVSNTTAKNEDVHRENMNEVDITLHEYSGNLSPKFEGASFLEFQSEYMCIASKGSLRNTKNLSSTKHKYGSGFPSFKRFQLDKCSDTDNKEVGSSTPGTAPFAQLSKPLETISVGERAVAIIRSLLDYIGATFFVSEQFFMLESKQSVDMIPPKWASHFDKMKGIVREPGRLIVQIPPKATSLSIPAWYGSTNPYLRFIDAVYVCRSSISRLSQETFADVLGGSEQDLATNLHAALIAGLSILSIAGGDGLVEKLVMAVCEVKMDPIHKILPHNNTYDDWQIRNRGRCSCDLESNHRPLSPIAAAKAVGMNIWRERHSYTVNRVWDLKQDKLVSNINVKRVVFMTHRWRKDEVRYQDMMKSRQSQRNQISRMSKKLHRIHKTLSKHTRYVWLDTICIDKSNLSELDEVFRSMYKWYASCAAVVLDSGTTLEKWCSRGWCLQEGAAAGTLCGISKDGRLATIQQLAKEQNQKLCNLDLHLCYRPGNAAEILARMDVRHVTREEDRAYALAGIFSIDLSIAYGEGLRARTKLLQQLAIQKGDLSFLSFHSSETVLRAYLPSIGEPNFLIAKCAKASTPVTVSHIGMCFEIQLVKGEGVKLELQKLNRWIKMNFAKDRFLGAEELIKAGEQSEDETSLSVELAIVHDIRSLILVHVYDQDMQTGGGKPIKVCYRLQCCQIEDLEFKRLFPKVNTNLERIWLGDKPDSNELD
ncbi:unnamed protein product [Umbelopsis ramanniana]